MSGSSNILQFDNTAFNMLSDAAYAASSQLANGFSSGIAPSAAMNKVLYQVSTMAYALGQVMANRGQTILDTNVSGLITAISESFGAVTGVQSKSGAYTALATDYGNLLVCTGTWTLALTAAATLGAGWCVFVRNDGTGIITVDPNAAELIDGKATITLYPGEAILIVCDGTGFKAVGRQRGLILLQAQTASNVASVAFTNYITSDFDEYALEYNGVYMGTNATDLWLRVSLDNGSTWKAGASDYKYNDKFSNTGTVFGASESAADTKIILARACSNLSSQPVDGITRFFRPSDTNADKIFLTDNFNFSSTQLERNLGYGYYLTAASAITGIEILSSSGNIYGTFRLYGVRKQ